MEYREMQAFGETITLPGRVNSSTHSTLSRPRSSQPSPPPPQPPAHVTACQKNAIHRSPRPPYNVPPDPRSPLGKTRIRMSRSTELGQPPAAAAAALRAPGLACRDPLPFSPRGPEPHPDEVVKYYVQGLYFVKEVCVGVWVLAV